MPETDPKSAPAAGRATPPVGGGNGGRVREGDARATQAGEVISPGGFAVLALMPLVGFLLKHVQPKWLILLGLIIEGVAMGYMWTFSLDVSYGKLAWARPIQASGLAFLFVPISTVSYAGLPPGKSNSASAIHLPVDGGGGAGDDPAGILAPADRSGQIAGGALRHLAARFPAIVV